MGTYLPPLGGKQAIAIGSVEVDYVLLIALYGISFEKEYNANPISQLKLANHWCFSSFVSTFIQRDLITVFSSVFKNY